MTSARLLAARVTWVSVAVLAIGLFGLRSGSDDTTLAVAAPARSALPPATSPARAVPTASPLATTPSPTTSPVTPPASTATATTAPGVPVPVIRQRTVVLTQRIPFTSRSVKDKNLAKGAKKVTRAGHSGYRARTYRYTSRDGVVVKRLLVSIRVTRRPIGQIVHVGTKVAGATPARRCDPNYSGACVPIASDVDCAGGSGNGPAYVQGPVRVIGRDIYGLDGDRDGIGCE